jgi:hypothetical protein
MRKEIKLCLLMLLMASVKTHAQPSASATATVTIVEPAALTSSIDKYGTVDLVIDAGKENAYTISKSHPLNIMKTNSVDDRNHYCFDAALPVKNKQGAGRSCVEITVDFN